MSHSASLDNCPPHVSETTDVVHVTRREMIGDPQRPDTGATCRTDPLRWYALPGYDLDQNELSQAYLLADL